VGKVKDLGGFEGDLGVNRKLGLWRNLGGIWWEFGDASAALEPVTGFTVPPAQRQAEVLGTLTHAQLVAVLHACAANPVQSLRSFPLPSGPLRRDHLAVPPTKPAVACGKVKILTTYTTLIW